MSDHVFELLGAYQDGELEGRQLRNVEAHLEDCRLCVEEYSALQSLSAALHATPAPEFPTPERIAGDVVLRLPRVPVVPVSSRAVEISWWLVPIGLILAWVFVSTTVLVSNLVTTAGDFGLLDNASAWLNAGSSEAVFSAVLGQFGFLTGTNLEWVEVTETFTRTIATQFFWQFSIALLYLSWMAIWWARHSRQRFGEVFRNGNFPSRDSRPSVN